MKNGKYPTALAEPPSSTSLLFGATCRPLVARNGAKAPDMRRSTAAPGKLDSLASAPRAINRIFIVDPHPLMRKGIGSLLAPESDLSICGEAGDANDALRGIMQQQPDLVVAGLSLPGPSGLELIKSAKAHCPHTHFLILSSQPESIYAIRVLKAGGEGYVMKSEPPEKLIEAIRCVLKNRVFVSDDIAHQMLGCFVGDKPGDVASSIDTLSDRELDVMNLIGEGVSVREIAARLHISVKTVETHRAHLKAKLHIESTTRFVQYCARWVDENASVHHS